MTDGRKALPKPRFYEMVVELQTAFADAVNGDLLREAVPELAEFLDGNDLHLDNFHDRVCADLRQMDPDSERAVQFRAMLANPVTRQDFKTAFWLVGQDGNRRFDAFRAARIYKGLHDPAVKPAVFAIQRFIYDTAS